MISRKIYICSTTLWRRMTQREAKCGRVGFGSRNTRLANEDLCANEARLSRFT